MLRIVFLWLGLFIGSASAQTAITPGVYALKDCMDYHYGSGMWSQRTGVGVGSDIGPAISACISTIRSTSGRGQILINPGSWLMTSAPSSVAGIEFVGLGSQASVVFYNNASGVAFYYYTGGATAGYTGGGLRHIGILLESGLGDTNAYAIVLQGTSTSMPDQTVWEDLYISAAGGSSYWWETFHVDGTARTSPQGVRVGTMRSVQLFNSRNVGLYLSNVVQWDLINVGIYTGKPGTGGNSVYITGGGSASTNSTQVDAIRLTYAGSLNASNCSNVRVNYSSTC